MQEGAAGDTVVVFTLRSGTLRQNQAFFRQMMSTRDRFSQILIQIDVLLLRTAAKLRLWFSIESVL